MAMFNSILIVCVGNICRSPTAEYLFKERLQQANKNINVSSAGLGALVDHEMDAQAAAVMLEHANISGNEHKAKQLRSQMLIDHDLILVMENTHIKTVSEKLPAARGKTFLLGKWLDNKEIPDPYRQSREAFEHVYKVIDESVNEWLKYL